MGKLCMQNAFIFLSSIVSRFEHRQFTIFVILYSNRIFHLRLEIIINFYFFQIDTHFDLLNAPIVRLSGFCSIIMRERAQIDATYLFVVFFSFISHFQHIFVFAMQVELN